MSSEKSVTKAAGIVMLAMLLSRIIGFVRETIVGNLFGATMESDAYTAAFIIPDIMFNLLVGGVLAAAFIPVFSSYIAKGEEEEGWKVASTFIYFTMFLLVIFTSIGIIFAPWIVPLTAKSFRGEKLQLTIQLARIMFPAVMFTGFAGLFMGVLNSYKRFTASSFGPVIYNIIIITFAVSFTKVTPREYWIFGICIGVVLGAIVNLIIQFLAVRRMDKKLPLFMDLSHPGVKQIFVLVLPAVIGLGITQINFLVNQNIASGLKDGSITALRFANRLMQMPLGLFAMSIATAVFPTLTGFAAVENFTEFKNIFSMTLRTIFFISIPSAIGLLVLREPIIRLLFEHGNFTAEDTRLTAYALFFYSFGLIGQAGLQMATRGLYAIQDTRTPLFAGVINVIFNGVLSVLFVYVLDMNIGGVALAYSLTSILNFVILTYVLRIKVKGIKGREILYSFIQTLIASVGMGGAAVFLSSAFERLLGTKTKLDQLLQVGISAGIAALLFFGIAYLLKMEEVHKVIEQIQVKVLKRSK